jgi:MFS transporter, SP family, arabinose:H+ symporter
MVSETRATQPSGRNVLEELDSRIPTGFYWYLAVLACVGGFLFGYDTSNIGSALGFIPYHLSSFWTGYLVAGASLGAGAGALIAGPLTDRFGRKTLLVTDAAIYAVGALLSAFTVNAFMLLSSRTLIGLAIGADSAIATAYIAEFAPRERRGQLSIIQQWMITVGILVSYLVAVVVLVALPNNAGNLDWRLILGIGAFPAILAVALRSKMPESPRWLMLHDRYADTRKAFGKLGMETTEEEIRTAAEQLRGTVEERRRKTQWTKGVIRALIVVCVFFIFQQITGINIPFYYGPKILSTFFQSGHNAVAAAVAGVEVTAILGAVNVVATYFAFRWIDKFGRRPLAIGGFHAGRGGRSRVPHRYTEDRGGHGRLLVLHHLVRDRRRRDGLADPGRSLPDICPRPGGRDRRGRGLGSQLRADRGVPGLAERMGAGLGHGVLRGPVGGGDRIRVQVLARDKGPFRRGSRADLREAGRGQ